MLPCPLLEVYLLTDTVSIIVLHLTGFWNILFPLFSSSFSQIDFFSVTKQHILLILTWEKEKNKKTVFSQEMGAERKICQSTLVIL